MQHVIVFFILLCTPSLLTAQEFWRKVEVPGGASVSALVDADGVLYAGTSEGVSVSSDGAAHWKLGELRRCRINDLCACADGTVLAAGTLGLHRVTADGRAELLLSAVEGCRAVAVTGRGDLLVSMKAEGEDRGLLLRSTDDGRSWEQVWDVAHGQITEISRGQGDVVFCGTGGSYNWDEGYVYRSTDGGSTWDFSFYDGTRLFVRAILAAPEGVFAGGAMQDGVFHSVDGGLHWTATCEGLSTAVPSSFACRPICFARLGDGRLLTGTEAGVYASTDGGRSWHCLGLQEQHCSGIAEAGDGTLFVSTGYGVFRLTPGDTGWETANDGLSAQSIPTLCVGLGREMYAMSAAGALYRSTDFGCSWEELPAPHQYPHDLCVSRDGSMHLAVIHEGALVSRDGGATWEDASSHSGYFAYPYLDYSDGVLFSGARRSSDGGRSWELSCTRNLSMLWRNAAGLLYAATFNGDMLLSADTGRSWTPLADPIYDVSGQLCIPRCGLESSDGTLWMGSNHGLYRSGDHGVSWEAVGPGGISVSAMQCSPSGTIFAATENDGMYRSDDGMQWTSCNAGLSNLEIPDLHFDAFGYLYAGTRAGLYRSALVVDSQAGAVLSADEHQYRTVESEVGCAFPLLLESSVPGPSRFHFILTHDLRQLRFTRAVVRGEGGRVLSQHALEREGETSVSMEVDVVSPATLSVDLLFDVVDRERTPSLRHIGILPLPPEAGTATIAGCHSLETLVDGACSFILRLADAGPRVQAYPNPFRTATALRLTLPGEARIRIEIADRFGRVLRIASEGVLPAGEHVVPVAAGSLPSGTYFYRCRVNGEAGPCGKLLLLR